MFPANVYTFKVCIQNFLHVHFPSPILKNFRTCVGNVKESVQRTYFCPGVQNFRFSSCVIVGAWFRYILEIVELYSHACIHFMNRILLCPECNRPLNPMAPPTLVRTEGVDRAGVFSVNISGSVPSSSSLTTPGVVFLFEVLDHTTSNYSYHWVVS